MNLRRSIVLALMVSASIVALTGCGKSSSPTSADPILDSAPPAAPTTLNSTWLESAGVDFLYWNRSTSPNVGSYEIWEATTQGGTTHYLATASVNTDHIVLPNVAADCTRYYQVRARSTNGTYGTFSAPVAVVLHVDPATQGSDGGDGDGGIDGLRLPD